MITSTTSTDRTVRPDPVPAAANGANRGLVARPDQISTENAAFLRAELQRQPEIRPDVVARARALAGDPNYPPQAVLRDVAAKILAAPDLSETEG